MVKSEKSKTMDVHESSSKFKKKNSNLSNKSNLKLLKKKKSQKNSEKTKNSSKDEDCNTKNIGKELSDFMKTLNFGDFYDEKGSFKNDFFVKEMHDYEKSQYDEKKSKMLVKNKKDGDNNKSALSLGKSKLKDINKSPKLAVKSLKGKTIEKNDCNTMKIKQKKKKTRNSTPNFDSDKHMDTDNSIGLPFCKKEKPVELVKDLSAKKNKKSKIIKENKSEIRDSNSKKLKTKKNLLSSQKLKNIKNIKENKSEMRDSTSINHKTKKTSLVSQKIKNNIENIKENKSEIEALDSKKVKPIIKAKFNLSLLSQQLEMKGNPPKKKKPSRWKSYEERKILKMSKDENASSKPGDKLSNLNNPDSKKRKFEEVEPIKNESKTEILKKKLKEQLQAGAFRYVNEQLYTQSSVDAKEMFKKDKGSFNIYHQGYMNQIKQWPLHPLTLIRKWLITKPKNWVVADFGCGDARLAASIPQKNVKSLDLVAISPNVITCDMANTPLESESVDVAVFCLSLMGTNLSQFILEANRVLKINGIMKIAEVESRFDKNFRFMRAVEKMGFRCCYKDVKHKYFWLLDFIKEKNFDGSDPSKLPEVELKPCLYKKR